MGDEAERQGKVESPLKGDEPSAWRISVSPSLMARHQKEPRNLIHSRAALFKKKEKKTRRFLSDLFVFSSSGFISRRGMELVGLKNPFGQFEETKTFEGVEHVLRSGVVRFVLHPALKHFRRLELHVVGFTLEILHLSRVVREKVRTRTCTPKGRRREEEEEKKRERKINRLASASRLDLIAVYQRKKGATTSFRVRFLSRKARADLILERERKKG